MAFQGSLSELPLPDIIQLVSVSGKTGRFSLTWEHRAGQIYLRNGQIVHAAVISRPVSVSDDEGASSTEIAGEDAIYELATWNDGDFVFVPNEESELETIDKPNTNLLMEAARRMDEWQVLRKKIASTDMVPLFSDQQATAAVSLSPREWQIVQRIDERRSIEELAAALGESSFVTSKDLYGLLASGQVELSEPFAAPLRAAVDGLSSSAAASLSEALERAAADLCTSAAATPTLQRAAKLARAQRDRGRVRDSVYDLVHDHERILGRHAGAESVPVYRERLNRLLDIR